MGEGGALGSFLKVPDKQERRQGNNLGRERERENSKERKESEGGQSLFLEPKLRRPKQV